MIAGETDHAFFNCDLHGVYNFSQVVVVVPWYLPRRLGRVAEVSPGWILWEGDVSPPWNYTYLYKLAYLSILNGFERSMHL